METVLYQSGTRYLESQYKLEADFEKLIVNESKTLFGDKTIFIDAKKKIDNESLGGVIPDGFLFDFADKKNPEFYLVEVELVKHSFFGHIFPQITKFFAFFKNPTSQAKLIEKIYSIFENDEELKKELKSRVGNKEIFKFIKDTIENSQNILLIIDGEKKELPEITETYADTWGKLVKVAIVKKYNSSKNKSDTILTLSPSFENIDTIDIVSENEPDQKGKSIYTEHFHLEGINHDTLEYYTDLKAKLHRQIPSLIYNPQRYYISLRKKRNFAFFKIRKKKISIIAMLSEEKIRAKIKKHEIKSLAESVQKFYNGPCAKIEIINNRNLDEIIDLLVEIQK